MADDTQAPGTIGRYRIERVLGRGAMGVIYQAHDPIIDRKVAIKLIRADLLHGEEHDDFLARFRREAQAVGRCTHPNIVALYDFAVHEGNPFLAMEYVAGKNLGEVLKQSGPLPLAQAMAMIDQVLSALGCAHGLGIVHRDVKPANILLQPDGRVKMTDFGIARFDSSDLTQGNSVIGTPRYMSPEQCLGDPVDARSDLFSTGAVLYEALTGTPAFAGRNFTEVAYRLMNEAPPDIRTRQPAVPPGVAAAIDRALAKLPADRFASADEMAAVLRQSQQGAMAESEHTVLAPRMIEQPTVRQPQLTISADEIRLAEQRLTQYLGPIARILVKRAAGNAQSIEQFWQALATHIERDADRQAFQRQRPAKR